MDKQKIADKILSGRFLLTICCGVVFAYVACKQIIPPEATVGIITVVLNSYFNRPDRAKAENGHEEPAKPPKPIPPPGVPL